MREKELEQTAEEETLQKIKAVLPNESQAIRLIEQYGDWKQEKLYTEKELFNLTLEALNEGMILRQNQLAGYSHQSGNEIHKNWFKKFKKQ